VVTPDRQRAAAAYLREQFVISQRPAGQILGRSRSALNYRPKPRTGEAALIRAIRRLARRHPRYGYRRIRARLVKQGWAVNLKRVRRLWNELGLRRPMRLKRPRKLGPKPGSSANSCVNQPARSKDDEWTYDFIADRPGDGRPLK
jgi:transposase InsO family protein